MSAFYSITCIFTSIKQITNIQFYRGVYWYALFQELFSAYISKKEHINILADNNIRIIPISKGSRYIAKGEELSVNLVFPASVKPIVDKLLQDLAQKEYQKYTFDAKAHFVPGKTILFQAAFCNICGKAWQGHDSAAITEEILQPEICKLQQLKEFTLYFITPLRLKRRKEIRRQHHKYIDQENLDSRSFVSSMNQQYRVNFADDIIKFGEHFCIWLDCRYKKTMGGIVGYSKVSAQMSEQLARVLVKAQYMGIGSNRSFGFGFFRIKELAEVRVVKPSIYSPSIFQSIVSKHNLHRTLKRMNNHSPGPDGLTIKDLKYAGEDYLVKLTNLLQEKRYKPGKTLHYLKINAKGKQREIAINNITDRLISKALADKLADVLDELFPPYSFAFRKGKSAFKAAQAVQALLRKNKFMPLLKCDIKDFFPSVPVNRLLEMLSSIFYGDEIVDLLKKILKGKSGLPVGNPISPILSNLYLLNFDNFIPQIGVRMVRFSDDFVIFGKAEHNASQIETLINKQLNSYQLQLKTEKTVIYTNKREIEFVGYKITPKNIIKQKSKSKKLISIWLPLFEYNFKHTKTIYITFNVKSARTYGNYLLVETDEGTKQIAWSDIHRIVIIGKSRISGGAIRKAMFKNIPIKFLTITGKQIGYFSPIDKINNIQNEFKTDFMSLVDFKKTFRSNIIRNKINNQYQLLKKFQIEEPKLLHYKNKVTTIEDKEELLGIEGTSSALYFKHFKTLCEPFPFEKRIYHPPAGPVNVMLSFGYSLLYYRIAEIVRSYQLNPFDGILHQPRGRHMALASDFLENYRFIAENITLNLINLKMVKLDDFEEFEYKQNKFTKMSDAGFRKFIHRFEKTMVRKFIDERNEKTPMEQLLNDNVQKFVRCLHLGLEYAPINHFRVR